MDSKKAAYIFSRIILPLMTLFFLCGVIIWNQDSINALRQKVNTDTLETSMPDSGYSQTETIDQACLDNTSDNTITNSTKPIEIPQELVELLSRNPETRDFVLNYPNEYGKEHKINMEEYQHSVGVPLFIQWDPQWGYLDYGSSVVGLSGCGPICLSMAGAYVTGDYETFRPDRIISFALDEGYRVPGNGTQWALISEGGEKLGLDVTEIPLDENRIIQNLELGYPIICIMGPGVFTTEGHFIVLVDYEDGAFRVNDPNSQERSDTLWTYDQFYDQIRNLWVIRSK